METLGKLRLLWICWNRRRKQDIFFYSTWFYSTWKIKWKAESNERNATDKFFRFGSGVPESRLKCFEDY